jgi:hypothetical protein
MFTHCSIARWPSHTDYVPPPTAGLPWRSCVLYARWRFSTYLWIPMRMRAHLAHVAVEISDHLPNFLDTLRILIERTIIFKIMYTLNKNSDAFEEMCYIQQCIRGQTIFCIISSSQKTPAFTFMSLLYSAIWNAFWKIHSTIFGAQQLINTHHKRLHVIFTGSCEWMNYMYTLRLVSTNFPNSGHFKNLSVRRVT